MYYLQSRYYDPELGRFINADVFASTGQGLLGNNMFAYCRNCPVCRLDITGTLDLECDDENPINKEDPYENGGLGGADTDATSNFYGPSQTPTTYSNSYNFGGSKDVSYASKRGWSHEMITDAINAGQTGTSTNLANGQECAVYSLPGNPLQYVVIESVSRNIVQLSGVGDCGWIPDRNIIWFQRSLEHGH